MPTYPTYKLGDILSYEQPTNYIVESTEYDDSYPTPVLTAGKSFILGYTNETKGVYDKLPVIIFDDFTTASQFVDFKFKVKSSAMKILSCNEELADIKYMYYLMQITHIQSDTHKRYWISDYSKIPIPLPPLSTQHAIVSRIETLFAELDKGVEHLRTAQQQLKTYRQAVLNHWLNNDDGTWEMVNVSCFLDISCKGIMTGPFGTALKKSEHKSSGVPVLGIENIGEGSFVMPNKIFVTAEKAKELKTFAVKTDDIIISRSGTVGEICKVPSFMNESLLSTNLIRIRLNLDLISADYFVLLFQSSQIKQQVKDLCKGTTRAFLNQTILNQILFPLPPLSEQKRIVAEIESRLSQVEAVVASIENALLQAEALRQSILKKAFSGELVQGYL